MAPTGWIPIPTRLLAICTYRWVEMSLIVLRLILYPSRSLRPHRHSLSHPTRDRHNGPLERFLFLLYEHSVPVYLVTFLSLGTLEPISTSPSSHFVYNLLYPATVLYHQQTISSLDISRQSPVEANSKCITLSSSFNHKSTRSVLESPLKVAIHSFTTEPSPPSLGQLPTIQLYSNYLQT